MYETHAHSREASACAEASVVDLMEALKKAGYTGAFLTNHNWGGNTCVGKELKWSEWVDTFFAPYYRAREWGDKNDFQVFCSYEAGYDGTEFLIHGVTPEWVKRHPEIKDATIQEQFKLIKDAGGMVVHAHPFREEWYIKEVRLFPEYIDGVEGVNASHSSPFSHHNVGPEFDERAIAYAMEHNLPMTAGSDIHTTELLYGGMAFATRLESEQDFIRRVLKKKPSLKRECGADADDYILCNGDVWINY